MLYKIHTNFCWLLGDDSKRSTWLERYNELVLKIKSGEVTFPESLLEERREEVKRRNGSLDHQKERSFGLGTHHILPKSLFPELMRDKDNLVILPFKEHMDLHYFLWKHDKMFARQLWFGCTFGRKHKLWDLPGGEEEYEELKRDLKKKS